MNFLAHLYLSGNSPDNSVLIGNFIADFIKGNQFEQYNDGIIKGIRLHRAIDTFTDAHSIVSESKKRLYPNYHKFAGVIVDIFYDHFLAINWSAYSAIPLHEFADKVYGTLLHSKIDLPKGVQEMLPYMISSNWLVSYSTVNGIEKILAQMSRRVKHTKINMELSVPQLKREYLLFEKEFKSFFPEIIKHVEEHLTPPPLHRFKNTQIP